MLQGCKDQEIDVCDRGRTRYIQPRNRWQAWSNWSLDLSVLSQDLQAKANFSNSSSSESNERHREAYPRRIPRNIKLKPTPIHLCDPCTPQPFWLIRILDYQNVLGCAKSSIKQGIKHVRRHTLVGADSVVKNLSVFVTLKLHTHLIQICWTIRRAIGESLREFISLCETRRWKTNLIEETFAVMGPSDGRKFHKS
jgi:hypothetical protein